MEQWLEFIEGYLVSNFGRVRNIRTGKFRKPVKRRKNTNYLSITIGSSNFDIHRQVAMSFIPNPSNLPVVRHLDGNAENNVWTNLAWGTQKDNTEDSFRHGTHTSLSNGGYKKQQNEKLKPSKVKRISKSGYQGIQLFFSKRKGIMLYRVFVNTKTLGAKYFGSFESLEEAIEVHRQMYFSIFGVYPMKDDKGE